MTYRGSEKSVWDIVTHMFQYLERINVLTGKVVPFIGIAIMLTVTYEVVSRYFFRSPTLWSTELNTYMLCAYVLLAGGDTLRVGKHVRVDLFWSRLSDRGKALSDIITSFFLFAFCIVLVWKGYQMTFNSFVTKMASSDAMAWPLWPSQMMVPIGGILLGIQALVKFWNDLSTLTKQRSTTR